MPERISIPSSPPPFAQPLLAWYHAHKRQMPWRDAADDPYAVWISEIMLQQTTVAAVVPYFERWMAAFPTVEALAAADLQEILRRWAGLGYYARARNIKKAADTIVDRHGGRVPDDMPGLMALPGIGRYTAGAIASIAYGKHEPVLDGNVIRVLTRLYAIGDDTSLTSTTNELWRLAAAAIPRGEAASFNQAMMELGATVCSPAAPKCESCPVSGHCVAKLTSEPVLYPVSSKKTRWMNVADCCAAIERDHKLLFVRRPDHGVWGGLWELPRATGQEDEPLQDCARRAVRESIDAYAEIGLEFGRHKHTVMNRKILLRGYVATIAGDVAVAPNVAGSHVVDTIWLSPSDALRTLPLSSPQTEMLKLWQTHMDQPGLGLS